MHFYAWKKGLKTGIYYFRTMPSAQAIQFTIDQERLSKSKPLNNDHVDDTNNECEVCSA